MILVASIFSYAAEESIEEVNRHNVTDEMANPKRVKADDLFYAKIGYGAIFGKIKDHGTSIGFGYRNEMDEFGVDFGFLNYLIPESDFDEDYAFTFTLVQIQALYFFDPVGNSTFYAGGGLAYNFMGACREKSELNEYSYFDNEYYSVSGLAGVATLGYEIMRASTIRCFIQFDATLPFGKMKNDEGGDSYYGSSVALSMGIGY